MSSKKSSTKKVAKQSAKKAPIKKSVKKAAKKSTKATAKKTVAKKVVSKSTAKKAPAKKSSVKKTEPGKKLIQAKDMKCFWVNQGPILKNLLELEAALEKMSEEMFSRHVSRNRHDFAEWVEHVLMDADTAAALRKAKKPHTAHKVIVRQLKLYRLPE